MFPFAAELSFGYAVHELVTDEEGRPKDYLFRNVNPAFERLTGLTKQSVINRPVSEVLPHIREGDFDWVEAYGRLVLEGREKSFEQYSEPLGRWYQVHAYPSGGMHFITVFVDITERKMLAQWVRQFNEITADSIDYDALAEKARLLSGAKYAVLNQFDREGRSFVSKGFAGIPGHLEKAADVLGFHPKGRRWEEDPRRNALIRDQKITQFDSLINLTGPVIPRVAAEALIRLFRLGDVCLVKSCAAGERMIGDFTLIFESNRKLVNPDLLTTFADLVGLLLSRIRTEEERRRGLEELQKEIQSREENYRQFFDTLDDLVLVTDISGPGFDPDILDDSIGKGSGHILFANPAVRRKLGYTAEEITRMTVDQFHPETHRREAQTILGEIIRGERDACPLPLLRRDSTYLPAETRAWLGTWSGRACMFSITKDLSAEQEALQRLTRVFKNNPNLMCLISWPEEEICDVNTAFQETMGYTMEDLRGARVDDPTFFAEKKDLHDIRRKIEKDRSFRNREVQLLTRCGDIRTCLLSCELLTSQGRSYILVVMNDVTLQTHWQKEAQQQQRRLENVIEGSGLGTWEWNIQAGTVVFNENWARIVGFSLAELEPVTINTWEKLVHPEDLSESNRLLANHFEGKTATYQTVCRMKHKDGSWVWVLDRGRVIEWDDDNRPLLMFGTHTDITAEKKQQLAQERVIRKVKSLYHQFDDLYDTITLQEDPSPVRLEDFCINERERALMRLMIQGKSNREMARILNKSVNTIKVTSSRIYKKMNMPNRISLVSYLNENRIEV